MVKDHAHRSPRDDPPPPREIEALREWLPRPTPIFRTRAWRDFQRALDPLAEPRPPRPPRH